MKVLTLNWACAWRLQLNYGRILFLIFTYSVIRSFIMFLVLWVYLLLVLVLISMNMIYVQENLGILSFGFTRSLYYSLFLDKRMAKLCKIACLITIVFSAILAFRASAFTDNSYCTHVIQFFICLFSVSFLNAVDNDFCAFIELPFCYFQFIVCIDFWLMGGCYRQPEFLSKKYRT